VTPRPGWWNGDPACWSWKAPTDDDVGRLREKGIQEVRQWWPDDDGPGPEPLDDGTLRWMLMGEMHKGRCAICGIRPGRLVTDHDHETGLVRGFLCNTCNGNEARRRYGIYAKYRERTPAMMCGVWEKYSGGWGRPRGDPAGPG
jgi:hypothetical protein